MKSFLLGKMFQIAFIGLLAVPMQVLGLDVCGNSEPLANGLQFCNDGSVVLPEGRRIEKDGHVCSKSALFGWFCGLSKPAKRLENGRMDVYNNDAHSGYPVISVDLQGNISFANGLQFLQNGQVLKNGLKFLQNGQVLKSRKILADSCVFPCVVHKGSKKYKIFSDGTYITSEQVQVGKNRVMTLKTKVRPDGSKF